MKRNQYFWYGSKIFAQFSVVDGHSWFQFEYGTIEVNMGEYATQIWVWTKENCLFSKYILSWPSSEKFFIFIEQICQLFSLVFVSQQIIKIFNHSRYSTEFFIVLLHNDVKLIASRRHQVPQILRLVRGGLFSYYCQEQYRHLNLNSSCCI